ASSRRTPKLVALQDADCTTVGREVDFGEALADSAEESLGEARCQVTHAMGIGLEVSRSLIVDGADGSLRIQVEGIVAGEAHFDQSLATVHRIQAGADKVTVEKNVASRGHQSDVAKRRLNNLSVAADGVKFEFAGALRANKGTGGGANDDVAGNFLEVNVTPDAFPLHVAHYFLDIDEAGLSF